MSSLQLSTHASLNEQTCFSLRCFYLWPPFAVQSLFLEVSLIIPCPVDAEVQDLLFSSSPCDGILLGTEVQTQRWCRTRRQRLQSRWSDALPNFGSFGLRFGRFCRNLFSCSFCICFHSLDFFRFHGRFMLHSSIHKRLQQRGHTPKDVQRCRLEMVKVVIIEYQSSV